MKNFLLLLFMQCASFCDNELNLTVSFMHFPLNIKKFTKCLYECVFITIVSFYELLLKIYIIIMAGFVYAIYTTIKNHNKAKNTDSNQQQPEVDIFEKIKASVSMLANISSKIKDIQQKWFFDIIKMGLENINKFEFYFYLQYMLVDFALNKAYYRSKILKRFNVLITVLNIITIWSLLQFMDSALNKADNDLVLSYFKIKAAKDVLLKLFALSFIMNIFLRSCMAIRYRV